MLLSFQKKPTYTGTTHATDQAIEQMAEEKYKMEGKIRGFFHAYIGQEAIAAGCMTASRPDDPFITGYRDHGLALSKELAPMPAWLSCMENLPGREGEGW